MVPEILVPSAKARAGICGRFPSLIKSFMASWGRPLASPGWHACTILVSAFLLFQVEPLIAKLILPWFGGSAAVWTTCLVFFQLTLLLAYLYAHGSLRLPPRTQGRVHAGLLLASLAFLPVLPGSRWQPRGASPTLEILGLLAATVGPPFFMLATTGPLVQAWAVRRHPGAAPWRLYALSNTGSLLALLSYPVLVEPHLATRSQARGWSLGYALFVLLAAGAALAPAGPARAGEAPEAAPGPPPAPPRASRGRPGSRSPAPTSSSAPPAPQHSTLGSSRMVCR